MRYRVLTDLSDGLEDIAERVPNKVSREQITKLFSIGARGLRNARSIYNYARWRISHVAHYCASTILFFPIQSDSSFIKLHTDNTRHVCANDIVTSNPRRQNVKELN